MIDLRSDTVTRPTQAMLAAMMDAELGDDVLGDDPTVIALQERCAALLEKEAAIYVPSGSMANQSAIRAQTSPGDEIIAHELGHIIEHESGAPAALSGVMVRMLRGRHGQFTAEDVENAIRPDDPHFAPSRLLVIENTHNGGGGTVWQHDHFLDVVSAARRNGLRIHLDGARLWNACAATGLEPADYARHVDTVSCCFSKGLGAPVGSIVAGDRDTMNRVYRLRKLFGGAMRQSGLLAAAALYAIDNHRDRLVEDHAKARRFAEAIAAIPAINVDLDAVQTNMVFFEVDPSLGTASEFSQRLHNSGVLIFDTGRQQLRAVFHMDVSEQQVGEAIEAVRRATESTAPWAV